MSSKLTKRNKVVHKGQHKAYSNKFRKSSTYQNDRPIIKGGIPPQTTHFDLSDKNKNYGAISSKPISHLQKYANNDEWVNKVKANIAQKRTIITPQEFPSLNSPSSPPIPIEEEEEDTWLAGPDNLDHVTELNQEILIIHNEHQPEEVRTELDEPTIFIVNEQVVTEEKTELVEEASTFSLFSFPLSPPPAYTYTIQPAVIKEDINDEKQSQMKYIIKLLTNLGLLSHESDFQKEKIDDSIFLVLSQDHWQEFNWPLGDLWLWTWACELVKNATFHYEKLQPLFPVRLPFSPIQKKTLKNWINLMNQSGCEVQEVERYCDQLKKKNIYDYHLQFLTGIHLRQAGFELGLCIKMIHSMTPAFRLSCGC